MNNKYFIPNEDIEKQQHDFDNLIAKLEKADEKQIAKVLSQREIVEPELTPEIIDRIKAKIKDNNN